MDWMEKQVYIYTHTQEGTSKLSPQSHVFEGFEDKGSFVLVETESANASEDVICYGETSRQKDKRQTENLSI